MLLIQSFRNADLPRDYVPVVSRGLSTDSVLFGGGAGPAAAAAAPKQAAANAAGDPRIHLTEHLDDLFRRVPLLHQGILSIRTLFSYRIPSTSHWHTSLGAGNSDILGWLSHLKGTPFLPTNTNRTCPISAEATHVDPEGCSRIEYKGDPNRLTLSDCLRRSHETRKDPDHRRRSGHHRSASSSPESSGTIRHTGPS